MASISEDGPQDVQADAGVRRRGDAAGDLLNLHRLGHLAQDGSGEDWEAGDAGQGEDPCGPGLGVELADPVHEIGAIGEIEVVGVAVDAGPQDGIGVGSIGLKGTGSVDQNVGVVNSESLGDGGAVGLDRFGAGMQGGEALRFCQLAASDQDLQVSTCEELGQAATKDAITAEDEEFHAMPFGA